MISYKLSSDVVMGDVRRSVEVIHVTVDVPIAVELERNFKHDFFCRSPKCISSDIYHTKIVRYYKLNRGKQSTSICNCKCVLVSIPKDQFMNVF